MTTFAHIQNGKVDQIIEISTSEIVRKGGAYVNGQFRPKEEWEINLDGKKNKAVLGYSYDNTRKAFIEPQKYSSWSFDEKTLKYKAPKPQLNIDSYSSKME